MTAKTPKPRSLYPIRSGGGARTAPPAFTPRRWRPSPGAHRARRPRPRNGAGRRPAVEGRRSGAHGAAGRREGRPGPEAIAELAKAAQGPEADLARDHPAYAGAMVEAALVDRAWTAAHPEFEAMLDKLAAPGHRAALKANVESALCACLARVPGAITCPCRRWWRSARGSPRPRRAIRRGRGGAATCGG